LYSGSNPLETSGINKEFEMSNEEYFVAHFSFKDQLRNQNKKSPAYSVRLF
jgi:hypothetical protein